MGFQHLSAIGFAQQWGKKRSIAHLVKHLGHFSGIILPHGRPRSDKKLFHLIIERLSDRDILLLDVGCADLSV